jgi:hypothetical protein
VISKDINVSDKSHWKEISFRLTTNWSDFLILVSFRRKMPSWSGVAIFIHISMWENGECKESSRQRTKNLWTLKFLKYLNLKNIPNQKWVEQVFRK